MLEGFINTQVTRRGLDERTEKAYRLDLDHFYRWLEQEQTFDVGSGEKDWEEEIEAYLDYLIDQKGLCRSTVIRKQRVLSYYLDYLVKQGALVKRRPLKSISIRLTPAEGLPSFHSLLSKREVDLFFQALNQEYQSLDSLFRKRICLRDLVMMKLLFYHGLEISELLRMETKDYDRKTGILTVHRKRDRGYRVYLFSQALREQMGLWLEEREYLEKDNEYHSRMFLSKLGRPLSMKMVIMIFDKYRVMAGIQKEFTPKDLKKSMKRYAQELFVERCGSVAGW